MKELTSSVPLIFYLFSKTLKRQHMKCKQAFFHSPKGYFDDITTKKNKKKKKKKKKNSVKMVGKQEKNQVKVDWYETKVGRDRKLILKQVQYLLRPSLVLIEKK